MNKSKFIKEHYVNSWCFFLLKNFTFIYSDDSLDWKDYGVDSIVSTVVNHKNLQNGSIILCHNGAKYTKDALDAMITGVKAKGYEIVPVSELIYKNDYHMDVTGRQIKN